MVAHELRMVIADMQKEDTQTRCSGFEQQFKVEKHLHVQLCEAKCDELWMMCAYAALARTVSGSMHG